MPATNEQIDRLLNWLHARGVIVSPKIRAKSIPGRGIGIVVVQGKESVQAEEKLIEFPTDALLNPRTAKKVLVEEGDIFRMKKGGDIEVPKDKRLRSVSAVNSTTTTTYDSLRKQRKRVLDGLSSPQILSYFLIHECEKGDKSEWKPFLDVLPPLDEFGLAPMVWQVLDYKSRRRFVELLPRATAEHAKRMSAQVMGDLAAVKRVFVMNENEEEMAKFVWAWMCVNSRCLFYKMAEARTTNDCMTLAPLIDFVNHSDEEENCAIGVYADAKGSVRKRFGLWAKKRYDAGEEIFLCYGPHSNSFLLCEYGFMLERNRNSELDVTEEVFAELHGGGRCASSKREEEGRMCGRCEFLKKHNYLGEYTVSGEDGESFRTLVALASGQVPESTFEGEDEESRLGRANLEGFMATGPSESRFKAGSRAMLERVLRRIVEGEGDCGEGEGDEEASGQVRRLHEERRGVAETVLRRYGEE